MRFCLASIVLVAVVGTACNESPMAPTTGALEIAAVTTGDDLDGNGYDATVDGDRQESVAANGTVVIPDLAEGTHTVALSGVAPNCTVQEENGSNPRPVSVTAGDTTVVAFGVQCIATGPTTLAIVLGDNQDGTVGQALGLPLLIQVTDARGAGVSNVKVAWTVTSGDGALDGVWDDCGGIGFGDPLTAKSTQTNSVGFASVSFVPASFGPITVMADVDGVSGSPVTFTTDATDPGASMSRDYPFDQQDTMDVIAGPQRTVDLTVLLKDGAGNWVQAGAAVTWQITAGGGDIRDLGCSQQDDDPTTWFTRVGYYGGSQVSFQPTAFGITTVTATVEGVQDSPATFTLNATVYEIQLYLDYDGEPRLIGPDYSSDAIVPVGATVEWWNTNDSARITATSAPAGGTAFDSGTMGNGDRFQFVPQVAGTWEYVDQVSGVTGTLTAEG